MYINYILIVCRGVKIINYISTNESLLTPMTISPDFPDYSPPFYLMDVKCTKMKNQT